MIQQSSMNALHNVTNPYQGNSKKVLCVCSAGLLRSPTVARVLREDFGYNTRSCGVSDWALIPISTALCKWADEIVFVEQYVFDLFQNEAGEHLYSHAELVVLDIPDSYCTFDDELMRIIREQYAFNKARLVGDDE